MTHRVAPARVRAFSMIEVIVVVVILGVLMLAVVPRLRSGRDREVEAAAERVADLLSAAARRDALTSQRLALEYDKRTGVIRLMTMGSAEDEVAAPSLHIWRQDPVTPTVSLVDVLLKEAQTDGVPLDASNWRVEFPQNTLRPALTIILTDEQGDNPYRVDLPARGTRASTAPGLTLPPGSVEGAGTIDLDQSGKGNVTW